MFSPKSSARLSRWMGGGTLALCLIAPRGFCQHLSPAIEARFPVDLRSPLAALVDSAVRGGLPSTPLLDKALEGVSKGAESSRILGAVRLLVTALGTARQVLGPRSEEELTAAAAALRAGVAPAQLAEVAQGLGHRSLVVPLSVLSTLVTQGAPSSVAATAVVAYAKDRTDAQILAFGREVTRRSSEGVPAQAIITQFLSGATRATQSSGSVSKPKP